MHSIQTDSFQIVLHGDMPANLLAFTVHTLNSIFAPLLTSRSQRANWPAVTCADIDDHLQRVVQRVHQVVCEAPQYSEDGRHRSHRTFEPSSSATALGALAAVVRDYQRSGGASGIDANRTRQIVEQICIDLCIDVERALKQHTRAATNHPQTVHQLSLNDECTRWQTRWLHLLAINDVLRTLNATVMCDLLHSCGSTAYLRSFKTILSLVQADTEGTIGTLAVLKTLAHQLRAIQNAPLVDIADAVAPTMHCWRAICADAVDQFGGVFEPTGWDGVRISYAICNEFCAEIRRTLDLGGLAQFQQTHVTEVQQFVRAEQIVQELRGCLLGLGKYKL